MKRILSVFLLAAATFLAIEAPLVRAAQPASPAGAVRVRPARAKSHRHRHGHRGASNHRGHHRTAAKKQ